MTISNKSHSIKILHPDWLHVASGVEVNCIGKDIVLLRCPNNELLLGQFYIMENTSMLLLESGMIRLSLDNHEYVLNQRCIFIHLHGTIIQVSEVSKDFSGRMIIMSANFLQQLHVEDAFNLQEQVSNNPISTSVSPDVSLPGK